MLIIALVLAVIGLAALVFAVVTSNALVAWVCIAASVLGVVLLIVDALQERRRRQVGASAGEPVSVTAESESATGPSEYEAGAADLGSQQALYADYPEDVAAEDIAESGEHPAPGSGQGGKDDDTR
ncbi:hypothetical protein BMW24_019070 [Mycobacterium heckeshornense]|uniref:Uncharacterized protein n=1 Tax=Mycobacterium heckeshornense TaxID=110505 RepID=A0A2G8B3C8_9MYCO|nr:hypothetical protein [Mycobacterium heckeshornense]KMV21912.1 hypothetical protein ACT16_13975 [Mycobacterium heckeshornense]MCV7036813.1 hypothetical protein [Mycobacterium heckeshornense]PIJ32269.1 hypothetical protein BMW24_019070 [Mycobacterium heckeshornense]BCO35634.1 hypothetical protein MHEC_20670 [Mycobacterium heckeshornense]BCQ08776.1 hypothetical protein JMUB5695_02214 [Mycobacterium heckeshornense]